MECAAGIALSGSALFGYNRSNFQYDREQRLKKEFREQRMRLAQASLWRDDIRDMLQLTERKMKMYMLVSVLMLGFTISLWCEGRLPEGTPEWLMLGNQIAIGGAFTFLLLTVWLATYATVAAQSYATRLLTQLVRLPVPTWKEVEASRTYGSDYERVPAKQMLRVPFLTGYQERHVPKSKGNSSPAVAASTAGAGAVGAAQVDDTAVDPWGLERKGTSPELEFGGGSGADVAKLRHVKLMRQAAQHWQTYDAFARVSMSVGVNQLMLAISYFIIGYVMIQVRNTWAAFAGVISLIAMAEVIILLDLTIPVNHQRLLTLIQLGPAISGVAAYEWAQRTVQGAQIAECLAPVAFLLHAGFLALVAYFCAVKEHSNGAMLPFAFRGVLYLDAFAWVPSDSVELDQNESGEATAEAQGRVRGESVAEPLSIGDLEKGPSPVTGAAGVGESQLETVANPARLAALRLQENYRQEALPARCGDQGQETLASYYAMDFMDSGDGGSSDEGEEAVAKAEKDSSRDLLAGQHSLVKDASGKFRPVCPHDFAASNSAQDMRCEDGAPRMWDHVSADSVPEKGFYDAISWLPTGMQKHLPENNFKAAPGKPSKSVSGKGLDALEQNIFEPITGHDKEKPGILPWKIFSHAILMLCLVWFWAAISTMLCAANLITTHIAWPWEGLVHGIRDGEADAATAIRSGEYNPWVLKQMHSPAKYNSLLSMYVTDSGAGAPHHALELMDVSWPPGTSPKTLSCDTSGQGFAATDGLSTFFAKLQETGEQEEGSDAALSFEEAPQCRNLRGEALQDLALSCPSGGDCEALVLHRRGRKVTVCPLGPGAQAANLGATSNISQAWLRPEASAWADVQPVSERVAWIFLDPACASSGAADALHSGCASVATSRGRVAQIAKDGGVQPAEESESKVGLAQPDAVRALRPGVGLLRNRQIEVLDTSGSLMDTLSLPSGALPSGFCVGGGFLHVLGTGPGPVEIWRAKLPEHLVLGKN